MTIAERPPCIRICRGKHCRKFEDTHTILRNHLPNATETGCMGICKGPVVQVDARYFKKLHSEKHRQRLLQHLNLDHNAPLTEDWLSGIPDHIIHARHPRKAKKLSSSLRRAQLRLQHLIAGNRFTKQPLIVLEGPPGFGHINVIKALVKSLQPEQLHIRPLSSAHFQQPSLLTNSITHNGITIVHGSVLHPTWSQLGSDCTATSMQHWFDALRHAFHIIPIALFVSRKKQLRSLTKMDKRLGTTLTSEVPPKRVWEHQHFERLRAVLSYPTGLQQPIEWTLANGNHKAALLLTVLEQIIATKSDHCDSESDSSPTGTSTAFSKLNAASDTKDNSSSAESSSSTNPDTLVGAG